MKKRKIRRGEERGREANKQVVSLCLHLYVLFSSLLFFLRYSAISAEDFNFMLEIIDDPRKQVNLVIDTQLQKIEEEKFNVIICTILSLLKITA
jgi:hypothetical protein